MARKYPYANDGGFKHDETPIPERELFRGHPTSPGPRDKYVAKAGRSDVDDGTPGVPRLWPTPFTHTGQPREIEVWYDGPSEDNPQLT